MTDEHIVRLEAQYTQDRACHFTDLMPKQSLNSRYDVRRFMNGLLPLRKPTGGEPSTRQLTEALMG